MLCHVMIFNVCNLWFARYVITHFDAIVTSTVLDLESYVLVWCVFFLTAFCSHFLIYIFLKLYCAIYLYENVNELQRNEELQAKIAFFFKKKKAVQRCLSNKQTTESLHWRDDDYAIHNWRKRERATTATMTTMTTNIRPTPASEWLLW